jgi:hypothetical protein
VPPSKTFCPIDFESCNGACGPVGSAICHSKCLRGNTFIMSVTGKLALNFPKIDGRNNRIGPKNSEQHGVGWWARRYKCKCSPCVKARQEYNAQLRQAERDKVEAKRKYNEENNIHKWKHGTRYAWEIQKCDCLICLDHKVGYLRDKNKRRQKKK